MALRSQRVSVPNPCFLNLSDNFDRNYIGEDAIRVAFAPFSQRLGYLFVGIFDGHNGPHTANVLVENLFGAVIGRLADLYSTYARNNRTVDVASGVLLSIEPGAPPDPVPSDEDIDLAISKAFVNFDDFLVHESARLVLGLNDADYAALQNNNSPDQAHAAHPRRYETPLETAVRALSGAHAGSCALVGLFNNADRSLRVALTGDSRAVFGRRVLTTAADGTQSYKYAVHALSADQNAKNAEEAARLSAQHPNEPELLKGNRVVGWGCARAFGDGAMKWSLAVQERLHAEVLGDRPRAACKTPPYFTAEPVITTKKDVQRGDFAVFGSDGLWDCLTNEEVVGLVGQWLDDHGWPENVQGQDGKTYEVRIPNNPQDRKASIPSQLSSDQSSQRHLPRNPFKTYAPEDLPVVYPETYEDNTTMYKYWRRQKRFVVEDENVAAHLGRNAFGGYNRHLTEALLAMSAPRARKFKDDISIVVVFFD
ncbi:hypothetical protein HYPSUDRAFT_322760 [Hypholoma sublateritium FD-334 SS-4]|uniref:PPM-type phosphatase domain-containing protein n=1 Tax=Hypholoma sublateritium (strain FD-334 SS-4) TaxID=945553 RepID=A0A0D2P6P0_HYPSF|nr:hypothetical protein HYPSUDRAFT_322760 [Hypholoma sublateritium FD-334 SS-4]